MAEVDRAGRTALHYAAVDRDEALTRRLIAEGHDVNAAEDAGWTPLHFAAQCGAPEVARLLIDAGADVDARDNRGQTPLMCIVTAGATDGTIATIRLLRARGANPYLKSSSGHSPLSFVRMADCARQRAEFADLPDQDPSGRVYETPPAVASRCGRVYTGRHGEQAAALWAEHRDRDTVPGGLLRAIERLREEAVRNGNLNFGIDHVELVAHLRWVLGHRTVFDADALARIRADLDLVGRADWVYDFLDKLDLDDPTGDLGETDEPFDRLTDAVVEFCRARAVNRRRWTRLRRGGGRSRR